LSVWLYTTKEFNNSWKKKQKTEMKENRTSAIVLVRDNIKFYIYKPQVQGVSLSTWGVVPGNCVFPTTRVS